MALLGESLSKRVFACDDDDAGQPFQILIGVWYPVFIVTASPNLRKTKQKQHSLFSYRLSIKN